MDHSVKQHYLVGYGSLLSHDSRYRFSNIDCPNLPIIVGGWQRQWLARGLAERQTGLGVSPLFEASLNAVLLPIDEISAELRSREQDYIFAPVLPSQLSPWAGNKDTQTILAHITAHSDSCKIWICHNKHSHTANGEYPICQTYIDTCLLGAWQSGGQDFMTTFIKNTHFWQDGWINDRQQPLYPRAAHISLEQQQMIDQLLGGQQLLSYRQEPQ